METRGEMRLSAGCGTIDGAVDNGGRLGCAGGSASGFDEEQPISCALLSLLVVWRLRSEQLRQLGGRGRQVRDTDKKALCATSFST